MPHNRRKYPPNWEEIRVQIRARAANVCECRGECGKHRGRRCTETHQKPARWFRGTVALATAHLCNHGQMCANPAHLKALCQRCHLRLDSKLHWAHRKLNPLFPRSPNTSTEGSFSELKAPLRKE